ncbi:MAG: DUF6502 family protein [Desulfobacterales bacterium]
MTPNRRELISAAVGRILKPLVRILLRNGISYGTFAEMAKREFVEVAAREFGVEGRKQSVSRVAVITGLTRKEVRRLADRRRPADRASADRYHRASRVVAGWRRDANFQDRRGAPAPLPVLGPGKSFQELVRRHGGDVPYRAVLDELLADGSVVKQGGQTVHLAGRAYVPLQDDPMKLHILGVDTAYLIETIGHNIDPKSPEARFQRKVMYDNLPDDVLPRFRRLSSRAAQRLLEKLDVWLAGHDRDCTPRESGSGRNVAGIGIYYFEEPFHGKEEE